MGAFLQSSIAALVLSGIIWAVAMTGASSRKMALILFVTSDAVGVYGILRAAEYSLSSRLIFSVILSLAVLLLAWWSFSRGANAPLEISLEIGGIVRTRTGGPQGRWQYGDIFIQASAHLRSPASARVEYVAELIQHGVSTRARAIDDLSAWHIEERKERGVGGKGEYRDVRALPTSLSSKEKVDGWLHFQVDLGDVEITNSHLRLTARDSKDAVVAERQLAGSFPGQLLIQRKLA